MHELLVEAFDAIVDETFTYCDSCRKFVKVESGEFHAEDNYVDFCCNECKLILATFKLNSFTIEK